MWMQLAKISKGPRESKANLVFQVSRVLIVKMVITICKQQINLPCNESQIDSACKGFFFFKWQLLMLICNMPWRQLKVDQQ